MTGSTVEHASEALSGPVTPSAGFAGVEGPDGLSRAEGGSDRLTFVCAGKPLTWQRARQNTQGGFPRFFTPVDRENHMSTIRDAWRDLTVLPFEQGVFIGMRCGFFFDRPANHFRANGLVKDWALELRPGRGKNGGDLDNLVKLVKDSLNAVAYHDDTQIAELAAAKVYAGQGSLPRTVVELWALTPQLPVLSPV